MTDDVALVWNYQDSCIYTYVLNDTTDHGSDFVYAEMCELWKC